jgi:pre-rRNA-processing protein TSR1
MDPDDMPEGTHHATPKKVVKRVPKGTSSYQAAWIVDSDHESDEDIEDDDDDNDMDDDEHTIGNEIPRKARDSDEEYEDLEIESEEPTNEQDEDELDNEEEARQYAEYLARERENKDDMEFPDEVEAPLDVPAKVRFARYRALESFRTSPWDPYENLPLDYGRIFQFENFRRTKHRVMNQAREDGVLPGTHINLYIANVPRSIMDTYSVSRPFIVFGLLQYEHKMGVVNFVVNRNAEYDGIIKAKDPLVLHCGFRRFVVRPVFSQNTRNGKGTNNVHKSERFLQQGRSTVVTVYAPIQFGTLPVVLTKDSDNVNCNYQSRYIL